MRVPINDCCWNLALCFRHLSGKTLNVRWCHAGSLRYPIPPHRDEPTVLHTPHYSRQSQGLRVSSRCKTFGHRMSTRSLSRTCAHAHARSPPDVFSVPGKAQDLQSGAKVRTPSVGKVCDGLATLGQTLIKPSK